jgi:hypothetical protein
MIFYQPVVFYKELHEIEYKGFMIKRPDDIKITYPYYCGHIFPTENE